MSGLGSTRTTAAAIVDEIERVIVGKREVIELILLGMLARGHVLLEDFPGLAKTLIARSFAQTVGMKFNRIQFTPDLLPADITGSFIYEQADGRFKFRPGPLFTNLLLGDEINRAPPKTQAALLEAMQEEQVTVDGTSYPLEEPFVVMATQNPIEYEGTYPLPEAQLDRFLIRVRVGYPGREQESEILKRRLNRKVDDLILDPIVDSSGIVEMQRSLEEVHVADEIIDYMTRLVEATRSHPDLQVGASPRGTLALLKLARGKAAFGGRDFVTPDDVKSIAIPALGHRLSLRPELWVRRIGGDDVVRSILDEVPTPTTEE